MELQALACSVHVMFIKQCETPLACVRRPGYWHDVVDQPANLLGSLAKKAVAAEAYAVGESCEPCVAASDARRAGAGMMQWGNVHICLGKRLADKAAAAGQPTAEIAAAAEPEFAKAAGRFAEAARIKPDFVDGAASEANLEFERGKLAAGLIVPVPPCALLPPDLCL